MKLRARKRTSHKGQNGRVLVIGGSVDYTGAPTFVGMAASATLTGLPSQRLGQAALATLRAGADLVTIAAPEKVAWAINCISPDLITRKLPGDWLAPKHLPAVLKLAESADIVTVGNGLGLRPETKTFVLQLLKKLSKPVLIDADALRMVKLQDVKNAVLTPHGGEFGALLKNSNLKGATLKKIQSKLGNNVLVLKGHPVTKIISRDKIAENKTGHPGMTHGGVGDVLAGIIAGLIAQGNDVFTSAKMAAYVNGKIGEKLGKTMGFGYLASDVLKEIPLVLRQFQKVR